MATIFFRSIAAILFPSMAGILINWSQSWHFCNDCKIVNHLSPISLIQIKYPQTFVTYLWETQVLFSYFFQKNVGNTICTVSQARVALKNLYDSWAIGLFGGGGVTGGLGGKPPYPPPQPQNCVRRKIRKLSNYMIVMVLRKRKYNPGKGSRIGGHR